MDRVSVFIVDDSVQICELISAYLKSRGMSVEYFTEGAPAIEAIKKAPPHFVLLDYFLKAESGQTVLIELSEKLLIGKSTFAIISGNEFSADEKFGLRSLGVTEIFSKPLNLEDIGNKIEKTIQENHEHSS